MPEMKEYLMNDEPAMTGCARTFWYETGRVNATIT